MKLFYLGLLSFFLLGSVEVVAQKNQKAAPQIIINVRGISKYHNLKELQDMTKGQLIPLYKERVKILYNVFPYIGVTPKPGVSFADLGIPASKENTAALDQEIINRGQFIENNDKFLDAILPYSDTSNIINAILFYEEVLKMVSSSTQN
ncbi:hypothetical protein [Flavobacterium psychraquaticum]|uniref:hypothetical protein n=1 Tax=Flavobacterium psychraquaticum TaxID=3103958 RepID=UPI002ACEF2A7|nr:hypothetical protein [Flavobacterium sp. LB-N7T]